MSVVCPRMKNELDLRGLKGNLRHLKEISKGFIDFSSNDYLGFSRSKELQNQVEQEMELIRQENPTISFLGSTGSRLLMGHRAYIENLEQKIAHYHLAEAGLIYGCGYQANLGLLSCIAKKEDCIILDSQVHTSIHQGAELSLAAKMLFQHQDLEHLEIQLKKQVSLFQKIFVCVQSVYSMSGELAPIEDIVNLAEKYEAFLIVDEAHSSGVFGARGEGLVATLGLQDRVFARIHTFGKALGVHGAAVLGSSLLKSFLINFSKPFIYSTAPPLFHFICIASAYRYLERAGQERSKLKAIIKYFTKRVLDWKLPLDIKESPIQFIPLSSLSHTRKQELIEKQIDLRLILSPTVQKKKEGYRICLHAFNTFEQVDQLLEALFLDQQKSLENKRMK